MSGANQSYPQSVSLDTAKAKAADMQSQTSKAQGGNINPSDPASKARVMLWQLALHEERDLRQLRARPVEHVSCRSIFNSVHVLGYLVHLRHRLVHNDMSVVVLISSWLTN